MTALDDIRARWANLGRVDGTVWNHDDLVDEIIEHAAEDVAALLDIIDRYWPEPKCPA